MAEEKKVEETKVEAEVKEEKPAKKSKKKAVVKANTSNKDIAKATMSDFSVIIAPVITEKTMANTQNLNKLTFKVKPTANKTQIKIAFERLFKVKAVKVAIGNVRAKTTTRGGRYKGTIASYKKATITVADGEAIDLFKE